MRNHGVINTPPILGENAPSSSRQATHVVDTPPILTGNAPSSSGLCKDVDVSHGPPQKRNGDVMRIHGVINTPPILGENAPSSSRQATHVVCPLDFIIELVLQTSFSWPFPSYMLKFDISLISFLVEYQ